MPSSERTPLIQVIAVVPPRPRYPHHNLRRFFTTELYLLQLLIFSGIVVLLLVPTSWLQDISARARTKVSGLSRPYPSRAWPDTSGLTRQELESTLLAVPAEARVREWSRYYTSGPHLAGKNLSQAVWTKDLWQELGVSSRIEAYDVYLNYPSSSRLALLERDQVDSDSVDSNSAADWKVAFEASLQEDVLREDPTTGLADRVPVFHGYSANGNVTASYVYANYGTYHDFDTLIQANVTLKGNIALLKYGHVFRGLKVKRAEELGMLAVIMYSDPGDDGKITEENGYAPYPDGPARQPSSVQRGSVQYLSILPGDPTTPGYPSKPGVPRKEPYSVPGIPSLPISYRDALPLLRTLNGIGPAASDLGPEWTTGGLKSKGVQYSVGPSPAGTAVNLVNAQEYVTTPIWNVIGIINGTIADEVVVLGNHRDAWIAGGAGDPNSGSAALNEVVRGCGTALALGWKPLRTIVIASWDGEEYGLLGSTEWVEEYLPWLQHATIAYLNVDVGTVGQYFAAAAAPLLDDLILNVTSSVLSPNQTIPGQSVREQWSGEIAPLGSGSDFTAFLDFAGITSLDMGFRPGPDSPIYHYHSNYDSFAYMDKYGDPEWKYHVTIAKIWSLLAARLVESPITPFSAATYATKLQSYLGGVHEKCSPVWTSDDCTSLLRPVADALASLVGVATFFDSRAEQLRVELGRRRIPWWKWWEKWRLYAKVRAVNAGYRGLERQFLHQPGLDRRPWFKHIVFAPGYWTGYSGAVFPGIAEGLESEDWESTRRWVGVVQTAVQRATAFLDSI